MQYCWALAAAATFPSSRDLHKLCSSAIAAESTDSTNHGDWRQLFYLCTINQMIPVISQADTISLPKL